MSAQPIPRMTENEYLAADRAAEYKSEFYDGVMYAMSGASWVHNTISGNVFLRLKLALNGKRCFVNIADVRLRVGRTYTYPDIMAGCAEPRFADDQKDTLLNPCLIFEVLSNSTEAHDRGMKFARYRQIESLQEYVLVSQTEPRVEKYRRQANGEWLLSESIGLDSSCRLDSVDCELALADVYENVSIPLEEALGDEAAT